MLKKTVLITGASRGIGKAIALKFAKENYNVIINCSSSLQELLAVSEEVKRLGADCLPILADVSDYESVSNMFQEINILFPFIDCIINNAGISCVGLFTETSPETWNKVIQTNLTSIYNVCHHAIPKMISQKTGSIVNISSIWGISGASLEVAYSASKSGIHGFTQALAKELGPSNIRINAIACGAVETSMNNWLSSEEREAFEASIALCRFGKVEEIADLAFFLASENASYLTGEIIKIDGGTL
ncbi:MAG: 3-oxoacyl-ACP reductase [Firmicutes bacterium HGW-Firmicutes-1]|jgi:3-oxoacyl-[acyl-carrier protein] reductase|nr:MAG: 3-oxoacyl-ACP reductase [Firmicutes bacterium HGW-Firmicutes-1]